MGGAGLFPLVPRLLKERFGDKRVRRSPHPFAATAMGLAVWLDREGGYALEDRLSRHFGVFREGGAGRDVVFDTIFEKGTPLPAPGEPPVVVARRYRAAHDVGHFRFLECSRLTDGRPDGDVTPWDEAYFPFDRALRAANLAVRADPPEGRRPRGRRGLRARERGRDHGHRHGRDGRLCADVPADALTGTPGQPAPPGPAPLRSGTAAPSATNRYASAARTVRPRP